MPSTEKLALRTLESTLTHARVRVRAGDDRSDAALELPNGERIGIRLRWAGAGFPRDVERALRDLPHDGAVPLVVAAKTLSPGGRALLDADDVSWLTEAGAARLHLGSIIVERDAQPTGTPTRPDDDAPRWTPAIAAIAETVLADHARTRSDMLPTTTTLASDSGRSLGSVTAALQQFDRMHWTQPPPVSRGPSARRRVLDASSMLDSWSDWASRHEQVARYHSVHRDPERTAQALRETFGEHAAFGGRFAADIVAPFSSNTGTLRCYLSNTIEGRERDELLTAAGLTRADESNRVEILDAPRNVMSAVEPRNGQRIVSPLRIYADLLGNGARGDDAAHHLREVAVGF